jgi:hypothetical protein
VAGGDASALPAAGVADAEAPVDSEAVADDESDGEMLTVGVSDGGAGLSEASGVPDTGSRLCVLDGDSPLVTLAEASAVALSVGEKEADTVAAGVPDSVAVTDAVALAEAVALAVVAGVGVGEAVCAADALAVPVCEPVAPTEPVLDRLCETVGAGVPDADAPALSDAVTAALPDGVPDGATLRVAVGEGVAAAVRLAVAVPLRVALPVAVPVPVCVDDGVAVRDCVRDCVPLPVPLCVAVCENEARVPDTVSRWLNCAQLQPSAGAIMSSTTSPAATLFNAAVNEKYEFQLLLLQNRMPGRPCTSAW